MPSLAVLDLSNCVALSALPAGVGRLSALQWLDLTGCFGLERLPPSVWSLAKLRFYRPPCKGGVELPDELFNLRPLRLPNKDRFTLLSIDGGGMRGLIPGGPAHH